MVDALLNILLTPSTMAVILAAACFGLFMGAIPGLTATMAVALLVPLTFHLDPIPSLAAIVTLEATAIFAGDIPTTLVRIPGTPSSAAYTDDAYALTQRGLGQKALATALVFSVAGGIFGGLVLIFLAPLLAPYAVQFTSFERFWLAALGLSSAAIVARGSLVKGSIALVVGLLLSTVGLSDVHPYPRFTFGIGELAGGINFIPAMIGLFGVSEVLRNLIRAETPVAAAELKKGRHFAGAVRFLLTRPHHFLRSATIGTAVGVLPGAGADIAAWVSMAASKKVSRKPQAYGQGSIEGLADATTANNAALAGAWVPALVFGIPGDTITAIVIGVLMMKDIQPGALIFQRQPELVFSIYATFLVANLFLLPLGLLAIKFGSLIVRVPRSVLLPAIVLFCVVGAYAINSSYLDIEVMLAMGLVGFFLERCGVPVGPVVLGLVLGKMLEETFIQSSIKMSRGGGIGEFFDRPVAVALAAITLFLWLAPLLVRLVRMIHERAAART